MEIQMLPLDKLVPYEKNPRNNKDAVEVVANSIKEFGFRNPIIVDENFVVLTGHTRLLASKKLKLKEVPVIQFMDMDEDSKRAYRIADNKTAEIAQWDDVLLPEELKLLSESGFNMSSLGFSTDELNDLLSISDMPLDEPFEDDFDIDNEIPLEPISQEGDVWILGKHRLMCGDSTKTDDVSILMDGRKADLCITDPPYNVDYVGKTKDALRIKNDIMDNDNFANFLEKAFINMSESMKDGAVIYVFHADSEGLNFRKAFIDAGFKLSQCCVWVKNCMVMGRQDYHWQHEPILYGWKKDAGHQWYSDRTQTTLWRFDRPTKSKDHPTMKPIPLICYPINNNSKAGDLVIDLFGGSGSTLIASEQTNRECYTMELDPKYCDVIVKRYIALVGSDTDVYVVRGEDRISYKEIDSSEQME